MDLGDGEVLLTGVVEDHLRKSFRGGVFLNEHDRFLNRLQVGD